MNFFEALNEKTKKEYILSKQLERIVEKEEKYEPYLNTQKTFMNASGNGVIDYCNKKSEEIINSEG
jgi:peptidyl-tRNA hydrolase